VRHTLFLLREDQSKISSSCFALPEGETWYEMGAVYVTAMVLTFCLRKKQHAYVCHSSNPVIRGHFRQRHHRTIQSSYTATAKMGEENHDGAPLKLT
jgi:hypothetical protein